MILALLLLLPMTTNQLQSPVDTVRSFCEATKALDPVRMKKYLADDYATVQQNGSEVLFNSARAKDITDWERVMNTRWDYKILGIHDNTVTVLLTEDSYYFTYLGVGRRTQVLVYIVENGKLKKAVSKIDVQERGSQGEEYQKFKTWLLKQLDRPEPELINDKGNLIFNGKSASKMLLWLRKWNRSKESKENGKEALATVQAYLDALKALDHSRMEKFWAEEVTVRRQDGTTVALDRKQARNFREFERRANTKWRYKIIGAQDSAVTVLLTEQNDFYDLLGTGTRTQVDTYTVRSGRIQSREIRFLVAERGEENEVYSSFKAWLLKQLDRSESELVNDNGSLIFNGRSAPRMLYWLKKWHAVQKQ